VFLLQISLIFFVLSFVQDDPDFNLVCPKDLSVLATRFIATIMMHLGVEADIRQGLLMMKFVTYHPDQFQFPFIAFIIGLCQLFGGFASEIMCIIFLSSLNNVIDCLIRFMAFGMIAKIDNFYADALCGDNKITGDTEPFEVTVNRRNVDKCEFSCLMKFCRWVYKFLRVMYCSYIFYFMPFTAIFLPYLLTIDTSS